MRVTPRSAAALVSVLLLVMLAAAVGACVLAGPAQAAPGSVVWKKIVNPTTGPDRLNLCARGPSGSLYAAGLAGTSATRGDIWITRYKADGSVMWSKRWDGPSHKLDSARAMTVDAQGNVYVCGQAESATVHDSVVLKYSATGQRRWATVHSFGGDEDAQAIALDDSGNAYVTGEYQPVEGSSTMYVARLAAATGEIDWSWWYQEPLTNSNGLGIAVTGEGVCFAAGAAAPVGSQYGDGLLVKLTGGVQDWARVWDGPASKTDWWQGVKLAPGGGVVVAGETGLGGAGDLVAARYSDAGDQTLLDPWNAPGTYTTELMEDMAVTADGSIWVCGSSDNYVSATNDYTRGVVVRWSPSGVATGRTMGAGKSEAGFMAITTDAAGNAYVAGFYKRASDDGLVAKYTPAGTRQWVSYVGYTTKSSDTLDAIALGPSGYVYATGELNGQARNARAVLVKIRR
jgi:uncharacterized delta-60 repeat protein